MNYNVGDVVRYAWSKQSDYGVLENIVDGVQFWSYWSTNDYCHCSKESLSLLAPSTLGKWT